MNFSDKLAIYIKDWAVARGWPMTLVRGWPAVVARGRPTTVVWGRQGWQGQRRWSARVRRGTGWCTGAKALWRGHGRTQRGGWNKRGGTAWPLAGRSGVGRRQCVARLIARHMANGMRSTGLPWEGASGSTAMRGCHWQGVGWSVVSCVLPFNGCINVS